MTDKQRWLLKQLFLEIDMTAVSQQRALIRILTNRKVNTFAELTDEWASYVIDQLQFITAKEHNGQLH